MTAPDKPGGRGMKQMIISAVKEFATSYQLPVLQPEKLRSKEFITALQSLQADIQVVVAFRMLPEVIWKMPTFGTINLHGSLLPAYWGAAPIQRAMMNGETMTGVTTFRLQHEIDTGEILLQREVPILEDDDAGILHDRMMYAGASLMIATLDLIAAGKAQPIPQETGMASHAPKIHPEDARIDWNKHVTEIHNQIRAMSPYPGAWTLLDNQTWKIWRSKIANHENHRPIGQLRISDQRILIQTGNGELEILEVQLTGKRKMKAREFFNGYKVKDWSLT